MPGSYVVALFGCLTVYRRLVGSGSGWFLRLSSAFLFCLLFYLVTLLPHLTFGLFGLVGWVHLVLQFYTLRYGSYPVPILVLDGSLRSLCHIRFFGLLLRSHGLPHVWFVATFGSFVACGLGSDLPHLLFICGIGQLDFKIMVQTPFVWRFRGWWHAPCSTHSPRLHSTAARCSAFAGFAPQHDVYKWAHCGQDVRTTGKCTHCTCLPALADVVQ